MRKDLTTDSIPAPDWSLSNETDARLDRSSVRTGHMPSVKSMRLLRLSQVTQKTGLKKTMLYELQKEGSFPMRIQITSNSVGWIKEEVDAWIAGRVECQQAAAHKVNQPTRAVRAADLTETRRVSRTIPSISPIALPRMRQYYGEKIGPLCQYVRDVGVAGSNPVTPTIDFKDLFRSTIRLGSSLNPPWGSVGVQFGSRESPRTPAPPPTNAPNS
jgi:prophage regulatory protein